MPASPDSDRRDTAVLASLLAVVLFASPLVTWWSGPDSPWYLPYLLWLAIIALGLLVQWHRRREGRHGA